MLTDIAAQRRSRGAPSEVPDTVVGVARGSRGVRPRLARRPLGMMSTLGVILVVVGAALMVAEAHMPSHGVLGAGAAAALTAGVVLALSGAGAAGGAVVAAGLAVALAGLALAWLLLREVARRPPIGGSQRAAGARWPGGDGAHRAGAGRSGATRRRALARPHVGAQGGGVPVAEGSAVVVESIDGLTLTVRPAEEWEVH